MRTKLILVLLILSAMVPFIALSYRTFYSLPAVWPDEAIFLNTALNMRETGRIAAPILDGQIPGIAQNAFWYPPLYFYLLFAWMNVFGFTLEAMRILSITLALTILVMFYLISERWLKDQLILRLLGIGVLYLNLPFMQSSKLGRMEILVLMFVSLSQIFMLKLHEKFRIHYLFAAAICLGLAMLTHPVSVLFVAVFVGQLAVMKKTRPLVGFFRDIIFFGAVSFTPIALWLSINFPNRSILAQQLEIQFIRKGEVSPYLLNLWSTNPPFRIWLILLILLVVCNILRTGRNKTRILVLSLVISLIFVYFGKEMWYLLFLQPFLALFLTVTLSGFFTKNIMDKACAVMAAMIIMLDIWMLAPYATNSGSDYENFTTKIMEVIPAGSKIYLAVIPDPYPRLRNRNPATEFCANLGLYGNADIIYTALDRVNYVVMNYPSSYPLLTYVKANSGERKLVKVTDVYQAFVFKLKDKNRRIHPGN